MDDRCLERGELTCFGVSRFDCEARWLERETHNLTSEYIKVTVYMNGSERPLITRYLPVSLSLRKIKQAVAHHILEEIKKMHDAVHQYWKQPPFSKEG